MAGVARPGTCVPRFAGDGLPTRAVARGVRCENSSRCPDVLVNHAAETIATLDTSLAALLPCRHEPTCRAWRREAQRSMRPVAIVMIPEHGEDPLKMLVIQDREPVETFGANSPHKSLRHAIRLRGAKRRANDLQPNASKHLVKTVGEFLVPVADQEAKRLRSVLPASTSVVGPAGSPTVRSDSPCSPRCARGGCLVR